MRIISLNCNGIRSACAKGFYAWLERQDADVVCLQETKAQMALLDRAIARPRGWHTFFMDAEKPGYSGVAIFSRPEPDAVSYGFAWPDFDREGRYVQADFGRLSIASIYLPSGSSSPERQAAKFDFMGRYLPLLAARRREEREYVLCGDWNIAHKQIDLKNWRSNQKNSGFLPEERAWLDELFGAVGYVDAFRAVNVEPDQYTWWSNRGQARAKNVGWRIDYHIVTPGLAGSIRNASIYTAERFSDHAPLTLDYDFSPADFRKR
ncbi:MAG: exodeoxyribonuclease III [Gammaproteobacteria bacterium]|nr:exodeoxyribonuclease III [Gammaproteobacteria bacterium]MBI5616372.1 exodeoxyribonuclease III [Gammaproteobacteria bacterium]